MKKKFIDEFFIDKINKFDDNFVQWLNDWTFKFFIWENSSKWFEKGLERKQFYLVNFVYFLTIDWISWKFLKWNATVVSLFGSEKLFKFDWQNLFNDEWYQTPLLVKVHVI